MPGPEMYAELQHTIEQRCYIRRRLFIKTGKFSFHASPKQRKEEEMILNLEQLERQTIEKAMKLSEGNISRAARVSGHNPFCPIS